MLNDSQYSFTLKLPAGRYQPFSSLPLIASSKAEAKEVVYFENSHHGAEMDMNGPPPSQRSPQAMLRRLERTDAELHRIFSDVQKRSAWDDTFVDALCEPAETFTFGGVFAHIMTFNAHRRLMALDALRQLGVQTEGFGDPMEYEEMISPWKDRVPLKTR